MRINLFGGPGAGKSTTAAWLFAELKIRLVSVEHVGEYVKAWAYAKRLVKRYDQVYIFGKQQQYEYRFLSNGVKNIITDSPCFLSVVYAPEDVGEALLRLNALYEKDYPSKNIFLNRKEKQYVQEGRYQTEDAAREMDKRILAQLEEAQVTVTSFDFQDRKSILEAVLQWID